MYIYICIYICIYIYVGPKEALSYVRGPCVAGLNSRPNMEHV